VPPDALAAGWTGTVVGMRARSTIAGVAALAAAIACTDRDATRTGATLATSSTATAVEVAATELVTGDCLAGMVIGARERTRIDSVRVVSCEDVHELEVFATFRVTDGDFPATEPGTYPGQERVVDVADAGCSKRLRATGAAESFGVIALWPSPSSWDDGDRTVVCAAFPAGEAAFDGPSLLGS
jgi:hypothetical protein